jgi:Flp pilus assembly protein TadG
MRLPIISNRAFRPDASGVAAVEFALCAPIMMLLLLVGFDTARYIVAARRLAVVAATIGQMLSVSTTGQVAAADLQFYEDSTVAIFPQVLQDSYQQGLTWSKDIGMTVSTVNFTGTSPSYQGLVNWTVGTNLRPCNVPMIATPDSASPSPTTLPTDVFGSGSLIVVDLSFRFRPTIATKLMNPLLIVRSFYVQPRYVPSLVYSGSGSANAKQC